MNVQTQNSSNLDLRCVKGREQPEALAQMGRDDAVSNYVAYDEEVLSMEPVLKPQPRLLSLDDKILLNVARANVLSQITVSGGKRKTKKPFQIHFRLVSSRRHELFLPAAPAGAEPQWQQSEQSEGDFQSDRPAPSDHQLQ